MKKKRRRPDLQKISLLVLFPLTLSIILLGIWIFNIDRAIQARIENGWFLPPVEIYASPLSLRFERRVEVSDLRRTLETSGFRQRAPDQVLLEGDWSWEENSACLAQRLPALEDLEVSTCLAIDLPRDDTDDVVIAWNSEGIVKALVNLQSGRSLKGFELPPQLFAQYYGDAPVLRELVQVGQVPLACLQAITAIEDADFLEHRGVSVTGTLRAIWRNIAKGRYAEGGSTITQQLVKNYFLTGEKTIRRKVTEQLMALLLEARLDKDTILENYLNVVYMGANGPFQVRGFGAASQHYFQKPLQKLKLPECALLAAVVNSPGRYNPFRHPERATQRRNLVLQKMQDLSLLDKNQATEAQAKPLPQKPPRLLTEPAPYFVQAVLKRIQNLKVETEKGLKIYTTLNIRAQELTQTEILRSVQQLEEQFKSLQDNKKSGLELQSAALVVDVETAEVMALVGGRTFSATQYNRAIEAKRQIGSVIKPFVFLAALESSRSDGSLYNPLTLIDDLPFEHKYDGQTWSPKNYDGRFYGSVPLYYALKDSLNAATAQLGITIGLDHVVDVLKRFKVQSSISALPSLTLGALELSPWEVVQAYATVANLGKHQNLTLIRKITNTEGQVLYQPERSPEQVSGAEHVATLVGMMKQAFVSGTAKGAKRLGFDKPAAGKTGTTSDTKDAWFVGFTPQVLTGVWVGYDNNTPVGLTGASGALPIWSRIMAPLLAEAPAVDFSWPEGTHPVTISPRELRDLLPPEETPEEAIELIFRSADEAFDR